MAAQDLTDQELIDEVNRRGLSGMCKCRKWRLYKGRWDRHGDTLRCQGCLRISDECTCG